MSKFNELFEKQGLKYFVAFFMFSYVLGTVIFNVYFYFSGIGISEFGVVQLRYVFTGMVFAMLFSVLPFSVWFLRDLWYKNIKKKKPTKRSCALFKQRFEMVIFLLFLPCLVVYSVYVFPEIPSGFGGAKPYEARLVGDQEEILKINQRIAFETGLDVVDLPFELLTEDSNLAVGANVKILDKNSDRIFLILTSEIYLKSKSNLAKNLIDSGESLDVFGMDEFKIRPLIIKMANIEEITKKLYEPPKILTTADVEIVKEIIRIEPEKTKKIVEQLSATPERTKEIALALETAVSENKEVGEVFNTAFDQTFLTFREEFFRKSLWLSDSEKFSGIDLAERQLLILEILENLKGDFKEDYEKLVENNYLEKGVLDDDFPMKITRIFQGAEDTTVLVDRLNTTVSDVIYELPNIETTTPGVVISVPEAEEPAIQTSQPVVEDPVIEIPEDNTGSGTSVE